VRGLPPGLCGLEQGVKKLARKPRLLQFKRIQCFILISCHVLDLTPKFHALLPHLLFDSDLNLFHPFSLQHLHSIRSSRPSFKDLDILNLFTSHKPSRIVSSITFTNTCSTTSSIPFTITYPAASSNCSLLTSPLLLPLLLRHFFATSSLASFITSPIFLIQSQFVPFPSFCTHLSFYHSQLGASVPDFKICSRHIRQSSTFNLTFQHRFNTLIPLLDYFPQASLDPNLQEI
jgi:hypothetical protein